jgi:3-phosphoglycerate kinase
MERIDGVKNNSIDVMENVAVTSAKIVTGGTVANIFTITGGPILVTALCGEVTTAISNNACDMKLIMDPTAGADTDMCVALDVADFAVNSWIYLDGTIGNAAVNAVPGTALPLGIGMDIPLILVPGTIDMNLANSNPTTGAITWYMRYKPLKTGVVVTV